jgi:tripartite-type tricarboxylate transporter receptor subunit TctC
MTFAVFRRAGLSAFGTLAFGAALLAATAAGAQPHSFAGQSLSLVIGSDDGAGFDAYGRLAARHLPRFLPGRPTIIVKNMPGAAGVRLANWLYTAAPQDGTTIALVQTGTPYEALFGNTNAQFDSMKFHWLASLNQIVNVAMVWHGSQAKTTQDLFERTVLAGAAAGSDSFIKPNLMNALIGTKFKVISGYKGGNEITLAMERGEVEALAGVSWDTVKATKLDWLQTNKARILIQLGLERHPALPDVPLALDYVKTDEDRAVMSLILGRYKGGRPFVAPPGTPAEIVDEWRAAFTAMVADPEFLAGAEKSRLEIMPLSGTEFEALIGRSYGVPKDIRDKAALALKNAGG